MKLGKVENKQEISDSENSCQNAVKRSIISLKNIISKFDKNVLIE